MKLEHFMNDGADVQSQIVAVLLRESAGHILDASWNPDYHHYNATLDIGRLENCREQGYVVSMRLGGHGQYNIAFFEHRNSDEICLLKNDMVTINTPTLDQMWSGRESKWDVDNKFGWGQWDECRHHIVLELMNKLDEWLDKPNTTNI